MTRSSQAKSDFVRLFNYKGCHLEECARVMKHSQELIHCELYSSKSQVLWLYKQTSLQPHVCLKFFYSSSFQYILTSEAKIYFRSNCSNWFHKAKSLLKTVKDTIILPVKACHSVLLWLDRYKLLTVANTQLLWLATDGENIAKIV